MPDLTPDQETRDFRLADITVDVYQKVMRGEGKQDLYTAEEMQEVLELLDLERRAAFVNGRRQGWQDAGLSLDAQDILAASLTTPDVAE